VRQVRARYRDSTRIGPPPSRVFFVHEVELSQGELRVNEGIRISPVRLVDETGAQVGVVPTDEARSMAEARGLDLVEVAPDARPPVCRIMDFGKYKYELARKSRESRRKQHVVHVKEVKVRPRIDEHDLAVKLRRAREFLATGDRVKVTVMFRGREVTRPEFGQRLLERIRGELEDVASVDGGVTHEGRNMSLVLTPRR